MAEVRGDISNSNQALSAIATQSPAMATSYCFAKDLAESGGQFRILHSHSRHLPCKTPAMATSFSNENNLADLLGESPNRINDLFKDLENWEAILSSLPDFGVDQNQDELELPASVID